MNHALRRTTLGFSPALRATRSYTQAFAQHQLPALYRCEATQTPFRRAFTTSRCFKQEAAAEAKDEDAARVEELSEKARKREMKKVTTGSSAQALENDRPWHRAESQEPGAKDSDIPDKADMKKGKLCINDHTANKH